MKRSGELKRAPMRPGSGFARKAPTHAPAAERVRAMPTGRVGGAWRQAAPVDQVARSVPKDPRQECPALLRLARGKPCLLRWRPGCEGDYGASTVACHENRLSAGKGGGYKAHDWRSVWGCAVCHAAFDQPSASMGVTKAQLDEVFSRAWPRQLLAWRNIVENPAERAWAKAAAAWALERSAVG